jgi:acetoin utilization protein AcuB
MSKKNIPPVSQFMTRSPHTIAHDAPLARAHELMRQHQIRHLPVTKGERLVGVLSLGDLHLIETLPDVDVTTVPVEDAMSPEPYEVTSDEPIDQVAAIMASHKLSSTVVMEGDRIAGIFTTTDALVALLHLWNEAP